MFLEAFAIAWCLSTAPTAAACADAPAPGDLLGGLRQAGIAYTVEASREWLTAKGERAKPIVMPRLRASLPDGFIQAGFAPTRDMQRRRTVAAEELAGRNPVSLNARIPLARAQDVAALEAAFSRRFGPPQLKEAKDGETHLVWCGLCSLWTMAEIEEFCRSQTGFPANKDRRDCGWIVEVELRPQAVTLFIDDHWTAGEALLRLWTP